MNYRVLVSLSDVGRQVTAVATGVYVATHQYALAFLALVITCVASFVHSWLKPYWKDQ